MIDIQIHIDGAAANQRLTLLAGHVAALGSARATVGTNVNYARAYYLGSRPHLILPKAKKALFWKGASHPVRSVRHPGTKPHPVIEQAISSQRGAIGARIGAGLEKGEGRSALLAGGLILQAAIQRGTGVKTGNLRRSWHVQ